jgi:hypothetical protein
MHLTRRLLDRYSYRRYIRRVLAVVPFGKARYCLLAQTTRKLLEPRTMRSPKADLCGNF